MNIETIKRLKGKNNFLIIYAIPRGCCTVHACKISTLFDYTLVVSKLNIARSHSICVVQNIDNFLTHSVCTYLNTEKIINHHYARFVASSIDIKEYEVTSL